MEAIYKVNGVKRNDPLSHSPADLTVSNMIRPDKKVALTTYAIGTSTCRSTGFDVSPSSILAFPDIFL